MERHPQSRQSTPQWTKYALRLLAAAAAIVGLAALAPASARAEAGGAGLRASQSVRFAIVIPPLLRMRALRQPPRLVVTERDVAAGFVDLPRAVALEVQSNLRAYAVQLHLASPMVREAEVTGLGETVRIDGSAAAIGVAPGPRGTAPVTLTLGLRLRLDRGAVPGEYPWPMAVTLAPA